jgi:microcystin-dependent protein
MAEPFLSEIRIMSFSFPPKGWALCDGQLLPINQNQALFSLLGTTYGGDGRVNFALPDLRSRLPMHMGNGHTLGEHAGEMAHTLTVTEMPAHLHQVSASSLADANGFAIVANRFIGGANNTYHTPGAQLTTLNPNTMASAGGSQPHRNVMPILTLSFCIALQGIFPSRN